MARFDQKKCERVALEVLRDMLESSNLHARACDVADGRVSSPEELVQVERRLRALMKQLASLLESMRPS